MHSYLLATDEAGYGPNLGPLVVGCSLWRLPENVDENNLGELLAPVVIEQPDRNAPEAVVIGDSKNLYSSHSAKGITHLERTVLSTLGTLGSLPKDWRGTFQQLAPSLGDVAWNQPWHANFSREVPEEVLTSAESATTTLRDKFSATGIALCGLRARVLFPHVFNQQLRDVAGDNKSTLLSLTTFSLLQEMLAMLPPEDASVPVRVVCDKHGGRSNYNPFFVEFFPGEFPQPIVEAREESTYHLSAGREMHFSFFSKGERFTPVALASLVAKYLRELAMFAWNDYWTQEVPGLRGTAGYPTDAKRFLAEMYEAAQARDIHKEDFWRVK